MFGSIVIQSYKAIFRAHSRFIEKPITVLILCIFTQKGALVNPKNGSQLLLTLNEHNCFITLILLKHFSTPRKDCYIFFLNVYLKVKNLHGNVHFNYLWFQIFQITYNAHIL